MYVSPTLASGLRAPAARPGRVSPRQAYPPHPAHARRPVPVVHPSPSPSRGALRASRRPHLRRPTCIVYLASRRAEHPTRQARLSELDSPHVTPGPSSEGPFVGNCSPGLLCLLHSARSTTQDHQTSAGERSLMRLTPRPTDENVCMQQHPGGHLVSPRGRTHSFPWQHTRLPMRLRLRLHPDIRMQTRQSPPAKRAKTPDAVLAQMR